MLEILGHNMDAYFGRSGIEARKSHETTDKRYQVWEISEFEFDRLCQTDEAGYLDGEWWRSAEGSNMGEVSRRFKINNHYIKAWDGETRIETEEENKTLPVEDRFSISREYPGLAEYLCDEIGVGQPRNVCALCVDLAKQNNISISTLFQRYYRGR